MKAKDYLSQIDKITMMIKNKDIEINHWKDIASNTSAPALGDKVKSSGAKDTMANAVVNYADVENELLDQKQHLINMHNAIIRTIEQLPTQEYDVLHLIYIQHMALDDVAIHKKKSYSWVASVHGRALARVQRMLNERMGYEKGNKQR